MVYTLTRGHSPRFGGGELALLPMENLVADANVKGILDEFFVIIPDKEHPGCFVPYLYVVLEHGFSVADVEPAIRAALDDFMQPEEIFALPGGRSSTSRPTASGWLLSCLKSRRGVPGASGP